MGVRLAVFAAFLVLAGTADAAPARWTTAPPLLQARAAHAVVTVGVSIYAIGGTVVFQSASGRRDVDIDDFWVSYGVTARRADELAVELLLPPPAEGTRTAFRRLTRTNDDLAKLNVAVHLDMHGGTCTHARLAMGCVAPTPLRLRHTEALLKGREITADLLQRVVESVPAEISPIDDKRSTAEYRRQVAGVVLKRAIEDACRAN